MKNILSILNKINIKNNFSYITLVFMFVGSLCVSVLLTSPVKAAYGDMSPTLPDDTYKLFLPPSYTTEANSNGLNCYISSSSHGDCRAGGDTGASHQYLTLSRGSINDDPGNPPKYPYAAYKIQLRIYTNSAGKNSSKPISINLVDRGIGAVRACSGYDIRTTYFDGNNVEIPGGTTKSINNGCTAYNFNQYPRTGFREIVSNGQPTGIYMGVIEFMLPPGTALSKQASFHASTGNNARLGYKETANPASDPSSGSSFGSPAAGLDGWVNTYPTNSADKHKIKFRFSPPCETPANTPFVIAWDDVDISGSHQPASEGPVTMTVYKERRDGSGRVAIYNNTFSDLIEPTTKSFGTENYSNGKPYVYTVQFNNIYGGNGISFRYPFPSANFFLECPDPCPPGGCPSTCPPGSPGCPGGTPPRWRLDPGTLIVNQTNPYAPRWPNPTATTNARQGQNVDRAKTAFGAARFKHYVDEKNGQRAATNGEHRWTVQFKTIRDGGADSPINDKPAPLNSLSVHTPAGGNGILVDNSRPNVNSDGMKFLFRNAADTEYRNPREGDGNPDTLDGDQYCERVRDNNGGAPYPNGVANPHVSSWKCVELSFNPPPDPCQPWTVGAASSVTGGVFGSPSSAWVGETYSFNYAFWKNGPANSTQNIDFYHNTGGPPTHSQTLGFWGEGYPHTVQASNGGMTITDQMAWTPTSSSGADNCSTFGNDSITLGLTVPYYYHLKPTSTDLSDKTQQGDAISPELKIDLPARDDQGDLSGEAAGDNQGGRSHTYSAPTDWRIIEFRTSNINDAKNEIPKNRSGGSGDCAEMAGFNIEGFDGCNNVAAGNHTFAIEEKTFGYTRPAQIDPIGTNICYVGVTMRPVEADDDFATVEVAARYSNVSCTTIVKSPKIQFLSGDITVGRHRLTDGGTPCAPPDPSASIQATGAPSAAPMPNNIYGSWVEYGAFASGSITGFGTAAWADSGTTNHRKLMFSNTPASGNFVYGAKCLSNDLFESVKTEETAKVTDITAQAPDLKINEYFASPGSNTPQDDKTGYVANNAAGTNPKDVVINQAPPPVTPLDDSFDSFRGRDIIIYAKKGAGACGAANVGGNITIKTDITYNKTGYGDISQLPRIIMLADCSITVEDNVKRLDAWLIAKDAVMTCSAATGTKFVASTVTHTDCTEQLVINGPVQAKRLLLWRTHGSDLTDLVKAREAAEIFNLRSDHMLSTFSRGQNAGKPHTIYQTELPPLY